MTKFTKEEVKYSRGMFDSHCGQVFTDDKGYCKHYIPHEKKGFTVSGDCELVQGPIHPVYWCTEFAKAKK